MIDRKENIWNVPNVLTMLRMALIGVFCALFYTGHLYAALGAFALATATDFLDGYIARRHGLITNFGKLMDPLADKLMLLAVLIALCTRGWIPVWIILVIAAKEMYMVLGAAYMLRRGVVVQAHFIGKAATAAFALAVVVTFFHEHTAPVDLALQILGVALTLWAMAHYTLDSVRAVREAKPKA